MRGLEVRRHSLTTKGPGRGRGSHLSASGVALAREVGAQLGRVGHVLTSTSPRTVETALAMGHAVDDVDMPSGYVPGEVEHHARWGWVQPYATDAELVRKGGGLAAVAQVHHDLWSSAVESVPDGGGALVVTHGGCMEPALVRCMMDAEHAAWGAPFAHCDGATLTYSRGRSVDVTIRRAPSLLP